MKKLISVVMLFALTASLSGCLVAAAGAGAGGGYVYKKEEDKGKVP